MPSAKKPGDAANTIVVTLSFATDTDTSPSGHFPSTECWETCFVKVRKWDNPDRSIRPTASPIVSNRLEDLPNAVRKALTDAGIKVHAV